MVFRSGDGVGDNADAFPADGLLCRDVDGDSCDDCVSGADDPASDGLDTDTDGLCDAGDLDDDGDGVEDLVDAFPLDASETADTDGDGTGDNEDAFPADATETADTDGDGVGDNADAFPADGLLCRDVDADGCDDCGSGIDDPSSDGPDADADGLCDIGDQDDDNDGVNDWADHYPLDASETVVVFNTGAAQKYLEVMRMDLPRLDRKAVDWEAFGGATTD